MYVWKDWSVRFERLLLLRLVLEGLPAAPHQLEQTRDGLVGIADVDDDPTVGERFDQRSDAPEYMGFFARWTLSVPFKGAGA